MTPSINFLANQDKNYIKILGNDSSDLINRLSTNNISDKNQNESVITIFTDENGRFIDVVNVLNISKNIIIMEVSKCFSQDIIDWMERYIFDEDIDISLIPDYESFSIFNKSNTEPKIVDFNSIEKNKVHAISINGVETYVVSTEFYNGHKCFKLIYLSSKDAKSKLINYFSDNKIILLDDKKFEEFRVKNLIPVAGKEIINKYNPLELNMNKYIDFDKGCYIGQEVIARLDTYKKVQRSMILIDLVKDKSFINNKSCEITSSISNYSIGLVKKKLLLN